MYAIKKRNSRPVNTELAWKFPFLMILEPHFLNLPEEGAPADGAGFKQHFQGNLAVAPAFDETGEIFRDIGFGTAEADALGFGRTYAL